MPYKTWCNDIRYGWNLCWCAIWDPWISVYNTFALLVKRFLQRTKILLFCFKINMMDSFCGKFKMNKNALDFQKIFFKPKKLPCKNEHNLVMRFGLSTTLNEAKAIKSFRLQNQKICLWKLIEQIFFTYFVTENKVLLTGLYCTKIYLRVQCVLYFKLIFGLRIVHDNKIHAEWLLC